MSLRRKNTAADLIVNGAEYVANMPAILIHEASLFDV